MGEHTRDHLSGGLHLSISNYAHILLRFWVENTDLGVSAIVRSAIFMPTRAKSRIFYS
ncbi:hypothetical protein QUA40_05975 [Microcoleus sp. Pol11C3]|uniref:hypothetical protein n=1 Tax=Microcoleus sp. Pol11C3 TaxID=3055390 RepID=UPI002FD4F1D1